MTTVSIMHQLADNNETVNGTDNSTLPQVTDSDTDDFIFISLTSTILGVLILATIVGNVFVIAAILLERHLHSVANYLIVSLAVADLLVACLVMPLGAVNEISRKWILGPELCDMWTSSDVLCCTASILHLVAIAIDRYWAVTQVDYIHNRNGKRIGIMIFLVWAVALVVSLAPLFGWRDAAFLERVNHQQKCLISQDVSYQIFATCATFYVPLTVILIVYWKIFQTARRRIRRRKVTSSTTTGTKQSMSDRVRWFRRKQPLVDACSIQQLRQQASVTAENNSPDDDHSSAASAAAAMGPDHSAGEASAMQATVAFSIEMTDAANNDHHHHQSDITELHKKSSSSTIHSKPPSSGAASSAASSAAAVDNNGQKKKRETLEAKREKKAAKTLAIITGAFVVCWLPFFVCALLMPLCPTCTLDDAMLSVFLWLGYMNSTLNPIIYTIFSPEFRQAFKRLLCGKDSVRTSAYRPRKLR